MEDNLFLELVSTICKRPSMYTGGSLKEVLAFLDGYRSATETPVSGRFFDRYVCVLYGFPDNHWWGYVIITCSPDEPAGLVMIEETIQQFVRLKQHLSDEALLAFAKEQTGELSEPEKLFTRFYAALLAADEKLIRQLILEHPEAPVLWQGAYPVDVADQLNQLAAQQRVKCIPVNADNKTMKTIAPGLPFPLMMFLTDAGWKIDAEPIIRLWKRNTEK